jgi:GNAT superfamily N-acetyltransferase
MRVRSVGWRTDVLLREVEGAEIVEREHHIIVRTIENRAYRWGNYMLFDAAPGVGDGARWVSQFEAAFPDADYITIGIDDPSGSVGASHELTALGLNVMVDSVLVADGLRGLREPRPSIADATYRPVHSDSDWTQATNLRLAGDGPTNRSDLPAFVERQMRATRAACEQGRGAWFGAFVGTEMCSGVGIFNTWSGYARFQNLDTHPAHRRKGLGSNLVYAAAQFAVTEFGARNLVLAAVPHHHAMTMYQSLGFVECERQAQFERVAART